MLDQQKTLERRCTNVIKMLCVWWERVTDPMLVSQQTRDVLSTLAQCWASVEDVEPTLIQRWENLLCLLG